MKRRLTGHRGRILALQIGLVIGLLVAWQYLPKIGWLSDHFTFLDPFYISSPSDTWNQISDMVTGANGTVKIWPFLKSTVEASVLGTAIGTVLGAGAGLWLSNSARLSEILRPLLVALNAVPRIALIPVIVIIFGPTLGASIFTAVTVVFFVVFFNAYEGGRTVSPHVLQNARILGASNSQLMWHIRFRYVLAWTLAALPNAVSFGLVSVVTAEILTGTVGMGRLLLTAVTSVDSSLTFAVVVVLSIVGLILVGLTEIFERRWLHWWRNGEGAGGGI